MWFETFFRGPAVEFWTQAIPPAVTITEVDYLEAALIIPPGANILDVPCGNGRHAVALARRGYHVTGIDLSDEFLAAAREASREAGVKVDWRRGDMRSLDLRDEHFDGAFCFGNSFGYLDSAQAEDFLKTVRKSVRCGATFIIDTSFCAESILGVIPPSRWYRWGNLTVLSAARYVPEDNRLDIDYTFLRGDIAETRPTSAYVLTSGELCRLLRKAGWEEIALHSNFAGNPFQQGSPRLLISARRL